MTQEAIVDSAVRQGLTVIALTDHNSNANVQRAIDHTQENYEGRILVLPGVEVTTAHGHLLAYFAPDRVADLTKFLSRLDLIGEMGADNTRTAKSMSDAISEVERLGGIAIAAHIDREKTGFEAFAPGFQNWKKDIITSRGLYGLECDAVDACLGIPNLMRPDRPEPSARRCSLPGSLCRVFPHASISLTFRVPTPIR